MATHVDEEDAEATLIQPELMRPRQGAVMMARHNPQSYLNPNPILLGEAAVIGEEEEVAGEGVVPARTPPVVVCPCPERGEDLVAT